MRGRLVLGCGSMTIRGEVFWLTLAWAVMVSLVGPTTALAVEAAPITEVPVESSQVRTRTVVLLEPAEANVPSVDFVPNLRSQLTELNLTLTETATPMQGTLLDTVQHAESVATATQALLVAWITQRGPRTEIFLFDPKGPHLYVRQVAVSDSPSAATEELSLMLRSAIQARLDGSELEMAEIALPKPAAAEVAPTPMAPKPAPVSPMPSGTPGPRPMWSLGSSFVAEHPVSDASWQLGILLRMWVRVSAIRFALGYTAFPALDVSTALADLEIRRHPVELLVGYEFGDVNWVLVAESVVGVDAMQRQTLRASAPLSANGQETRWLGTVAERLRFDVKLAAPLWLSLAAGVELPINPYSFDVELGGQRQRLARVLPARPKFEIGFAFAWP